MRTRSWQGVPRRAGESRWWRLGAGGAGVLVLLLALVCEGHGRGPFPSPAFDSDPAEYYCLRAAGPLVIDGELDEPSWSLAPETHEFLDIEGAAKPMPHLKTRARMLWDDEYFYVAAVMEEPHVWASLTERDAVIYHENDFEVFIDPDGDNHEYYELEINALNTVWDLLLTRPYRDAGTAIDSWDIQGLKTGIAIDGTLNDGSDTDAGWSVEIAIPWGVLAECAHKPAPPKGHDRWRVNFSRVQWRIDWGEGGYSKRLDPSTQKPYAESNWVWSPQGLIAMHYPEMWGIVEFLDTPVDAAVASGWFEPSASGEMDRPVDAMHRHPRFDYDLPAAWALMQLYYAQRDYRGDHGVWADRLDLLEIDADALRSTLDRTWRWPPELETTRDLFQFTLTTRDGTLLRISQDGRLW